MTTTPEDRHLLLERHGPVLQITLNRPEARNALSSSMMAGLREAWDLIDDDPGIRAAIVTGTGDCFCAGADLKDMAAASPGEKFAGGGWDLSRLPALLKGRRPRVPLIAAVEGPAIAGGTELLLGTDVRVAGEGARFGVSEARWGLYPLGGAVVRLPRQIPYTVAMDMLLTGRHLDAAEALRVGLVGHVVPAGGALERAREIAERIAACGPVAIRAILSTVRSTEGMHEEEAFVVDGRDGMAVFASDDSREGPRAFAEKRTPRFTGR